MRITILVGALLCTISLAFAQLDSSSVRMDTLDNGLRYIIKRDSTSELSALKLVFHAGSKYDRADQSGVAYLVHQLLVDERTADFSNRGADDFINTMTGGTIRHQFSKDYSIYAQEFTANQLSAALEIEAYRLRATNFTAKRINTWRKITAETVNYFAEKDPLEQEIVNVLYRGHPYQFPLRGSVDLVDGTTNSEIRSFVRKHYSANRAVLAITSPLQLDSVNNMVNKYFAAWPKGDYEQTSFSLDSLPFSPTIVDTLHTNTYHLPTKVIAYPAPSIKDSTYLALTSVVNCLQNFDQFIQPVDSTLKPQLSYYTVALNAVGNDESLLLPTDCNYVFMIMTPKFGVAIDTVSNAFAEILQYYSDSLVVKENLEKCTTDPFFALSGLENSTQSRMRHLIHHTLYPNNPLDPPAPISGEKFRQIIRTYFRKDRSKQFIVLPEKEE